MLEEGDGGSILSVAKASGSVSRPKRLQPECTLPNISVACCGDGVGFSLFAGYATAIKNLTQGTKWLNPHFAGTISVYAKA